MNTPAQAQTTVDEAFPDAEKARERDTASLPAAAEAEEIKRIEDQNIIELAIERALDGVKAELEATTAEMRKQAAKAASGEEPETGAQIDPSGSYGTDAGEEPAAAKSDAPPPSGSVALAPPQGARPDGVAPEAGDADRAGDEASEAAKPLGQILARMGPPATLEELNRAIGATGGRPLDSILEGIMRPIVREWLANNLPSLAERLVREEIERISRRNR